MGEAAHALQAALVGEKPFAGVGGTPASGGLLWRDQHALCVNGEGGVHKRVPAAVLAEALRYHDAAWRSEARQ
jgi:hypothetical protein